jgi:hypothetical protein
MTRTVQTCAAGVLVLLLCACTGDSPPDAATTSTPTTAASATTVARTTKAAAANFRADTRRVCTRVDRVFEGPELDRFAKRLGQLIRFKQAKDARKALAAREGAKGELRSLAVALRRTTASAKDPDLRAAGAESAANIEASATDNAFFSTLKTIKDVNRNLEAEFTPWMTPVATYCA